jgi:superfamily II DNA or RNA helicase
MIECSNPNKIKALIYLLKIHENDNTIIFCDYIALIKALAQKFKIPAIYGDIPT